MKRLAPLFALALLAGCVCTTATVKPVPTATVPDPPTVHVYRFAILYPFEVADLSYGDLRLGKYSTTGGAAELVPMFDAAGKFVGTFIGTAAKTAVK